MIAGIDLGGTQVRVGLAGSDGNIADLARIATRELDGPEGMVAWAPGAAHTQGRNAESSTPRNMNTSSPPNSPGKGR